MAEADDEKGREFPLTSWESHRY